MSVDLIKHRINLLKNTDGIKKLPVGFKFKVNFICDASGSMDTSYRIGKIQSIIDKLLPIAIQYSPSPKLGMYIFSTNAYTLKPIDIDNYTDYVYNRIYDKGLVGGGTYYADVINKVMWDFAYPSKSFIQGMIIKLKRFLGIYKEENTYSIPCLNIFITDGENSDHFDTERAIKIASFAPAFFQFVGIDNPLGFPFLENLDSMTTRFVDNANFFQLDDILTVSDEDLYDRLFKEFPLWVDLIKLKGMI